MFDYLPDIFFLTGAENRVRVLATVAETPSNRYELEADLDISRATAVRILLGFEERGWVTATDGRYRPTAIGEIVLANFVAFHDAVAASQRLAAITDWFPADCDVGIEHFLDASVTVPSPSDSTAPIRRAATYMREAATVRGVARAIAPEPLRVNRDCVVHEGQSFEVVFSTEIMEVIDADPTMSRWLTEIVDAGGRVYEHDAVPHHYGVFDSERVGIGLADDTGVPRAYVMSENAVVVDWADATFQTFRGEATLV